MKSKNSPRKKMDNKINADNLKNDFSIEFHRYEKLREEVVSIIKGGIVEAGIKIDNIESRVKTIESIIQKCNRSIKKHTLKNVKDIVGIRVICLFKKDFESIEKMINQYFIIIDKDNKIEKSDIEFGYMSIHFIAKLRNEYNGPRYNNIKDIEFEIQIRTITMHAWAAISHYIEYKRADDTPQPLKKALNALSALFYIADDQFERFIDESRIFRNEADEIINSKNHNDVIPLDLDTFSAVLKNVFPDRDDNEMSPEDLSEILLDIRKCGINDANSLRNFLEKSKIHLESYENYMYSKDMIDYPTPYFGRIGCARVLLEVFAEKFPKSGNDRAVSKSFRDRNSLEFIM